MPEGEFKDYADGNGQSKTDHKPKAVADAGSYQKRQKYPISVCDESHRYSLVLAKDSNSN
jgi:hypothetical protein